MGRAVSSYARLPRASSTKIWRGTLRMRSSTARLAMPCSRRRCTSRSRVRAEVMPMPAIRRSAIEAFQPAPDCGQRAVAREVDVQRRHRDVAACHCVEVGAGTGVLLRARRTNPVDRTAARILGAHHRSRAVAKAEAARAKAAQLPERHVGHVYIENECRLERLLEEAGQEPERHHR